MIARSLLFVPGDRPERFDKAAASGAHEVILDLEDAVSAANKLQARDAVANWLSAGQSAVVRINAVDTAWFEDDLKLLRDIPNATVMVSKAEPEALEQSAGTVADRATIALLETVNGYMALREMAALSSVKRIAFGSIDFAIDSGIADEENAMSPIRTQIVLESRYAELQAPIDGVCINFRDEQLMRQAAQRACQLGFGGKLCIHPAQVAAVNSAYFPQPDEIEWARGVLEAFEVSGGAATTVDGKMVDRPVVAQAQQILAELNR